MAEKLKARSREARTGERVKSTEIVSIPRDEEAFW